MKNFSLIFFAACCILYSSCTKKKWKCDETVSYKNDIQPLFDAHCIKCHSYDTYAEAKALANSNLKDATINERRMPPAGEKRLTNNERKKIFCWIEQGALDN
jgi:uncharacterized membrane protein